MMVFKIIHVDMYAWLGRENHPSPEDEGLLVTPVSMMSEFYYGNFDPETDPTDEFMAHETSKVFEEEGSPNYVQVWTCFTADGRKLDLMDHEVELVTTGV